MMQRLVEMIQRKVEEIQYHLIKAALRLDLSPCVPPNPGLNVRTVGRCSTPDEA